MFFKNFWFITLCALLIIAVNTGLSVPIRIAIAANALFIIFDVIKQARGILSDRKEKN